MGDSKQTRRQFLKAIGAGAAAVILTATRISTSEELLVFCLAYLRCNRLCNLVDVSVLHGLPPSFQGAASGTPTVG